MLMRHSISLAAVALLVTYVFLPVSGQENPVIPHAQSKPPGPVLSPQDAIKAMTVPPGFTVELVASEPDLINPVAMHIDEKGRFWVTESLEYPRRLAGPGQDCVKVIEIGDDGKAKKVTTVFEGLNIPSGIAVGHGGVWLVNAPDLLYYPIEEQPEARQTASRRQRLWPGRYARSAAKRPDGTEDPGHAPLVRRSSKFSGSEAIPGSPTRKRGLPSILAYASGYPATMAPKNSV